MQYCIYLRKSRADLEAEARGDGDTLARHRKTLLALAEARHLTIAKIYEEVVSGDTIESRPEMQALLSDVEAGLWAGVLVMEIERLARGDTIDQGIVAQTFKFAHTSIITPYKEYNPDNDIDEEYFEFGLFMARREYKTIKRRLQAGRVAATKEGCYIASRRPYGYERVRLDDGRYTLRPIEAEAEVVRAVYDWYINGLDGRTVGGGAIAMHLNSMGIPNMFGRPWRADAIVKILKHDIYIGKVTWNKHIQQIHMEDGRRVKRRVRSENPVSASAIHPAIIDQETFDAAQRARVSRTAAPVHIERKPANVFAGLAKCAECGKAMIRQVNPANPAYDLLKCSSLKCATKGSYITVVEELVLECLRDWQATGYAAQKKARPAKQTTLAPKLQTDVDALRKQLSSMYDLLEQGVYTVEVFVARQKEVSARLQQAETALAAAQKKASAPTREEAICALLPEITNVLESYSSASSAEEKNALLRSVISRIVYYKTARRYKNQPPAHGLRLDIFPVTK